VFRLRQQVGGDKVRVGAAVGDHQHFRRAGRHVDGRAVQTLADLAFGFRDVSVARAKDFIHLRHRLGAESQRGNRLSAADVEDCAHAAKLGRVKNLIGNRRRRAQNHLLASRDARRRRQHQYRREQRRRTAGNIEADGGDRAGHLLATYARQRLHIHARQFLRVVEGLDIADRDRHGLFQLIAEARAGSGNLFFADLQRFDVGFIKLCAVFAQRRVAIVFDVIKNVRHRAGDAVGGRNRRAH
jgi:hypothetical protein